MLMLNSSL